MGHHAEIETHKKRKLNSAKSSKRVQSDRLIEEEPDRYANSRLNNGHRKLTVTARTPVTFPAKCRKTMFLCALQS